MARTSTISPAPTGTTAAAIARDAGIDPYRFRCWLRSRTTSVDRTDVKAMRAAAKKFAAEEKGIGTMSKARRQAIHRKNK